MHCGSIALPLARLPPPSIEPGTASIPLPWFLLAVLRFSVLPLAVPAFVLADHDPGVEIRERDVAREQVSVGAELAGPRARSRRRCPSRVFFPIRLFWRSKKKSPVSLSLAVLPTTRTFWAEPTTMPKAVLPTARLPLTETESDAPLTSVPLFWLSSSLLATIRLPGDSIRIEAVPAVVAELVAPHEAAGRVQDVGAVRLEGLDVIRDVVSDELAPGRVDDRDAGGDRLALDAAGADAADREATHDTLRRRAHADAVEAEIGDLPAADDADVAVAVVGDSLAPRGIRARDRVTAEIDGDAVGADDERGPGQCRMSAARVALCVTVEPQPSAGVARAGSARAEAETPPATSASTRARPMLLMIEPPVVVRCADPRGRALPVGYRSATARWPEPMDALPSAA